MKPPVNPLVPLRDGFHLANHIFWSRWRLHGNRHRQTPPGRLLQIPVSSATRPCERAARAALHLQRAHLLARCSRSELTADYRDAPAHLTPDRSAIRNPPLSTPLGFPAFLGYLSVLFCCLAPLDNVFSGRRLTPAIVN